MNSFVYGLVDPQSLEVRYLGKTTAGLKRPLSHGRPSSLQLDFPVHRWITALRRRCSDFAVVILEYAAPRELDDLERFWISQGRGMGWRLLNVTSGGEGAPGRTPSPIHRSRVADALRGHAVSPEARRKMAAAKLGNRNRKGKTFTEESRRRISETLKAFNAAKRRLVGGGS